MTADSEDETITVIPHQDAVTMDVWDDTVNITQEDYCQGSQTISLHGKKNLEAMIAALQKVLETWS